MPSKTNVRIAKWSAIPLALIASSALVWQASYSAFTATTENPTSNWTAGTVALSDDDGGTALFTAANIKPNQPSSKCIKVSVPAGNLPSSVKLYAAQETTPTDLSPKTTKGLSSHIDLTIEEGAATGPGAFANCGAFAGSPVFTGTLASFGSTKKDFGTGVGTWAPGATADYRVYKFTWTLNDAVPNSAQGGTASVAFRWEAQNS